MLDASFVAFLPHLRADVIRDIAAGKANANIPSSKHFSQVVKHEKVAKERVAKTDEIRALFVASNAATTCFGELVGRECESVTLRNDFNHATRSTVARGGEIFGEGGGARVADCIGRQAHTHRAGLKEGGEMHSFGQ